MCVFVYTKHFDTRLTLQNIIWGIQSASSIHYGKISEIQLVFTDVQKDKKEGQGWGRQHTGM